MKYRRIAMEAEVRKYEPGQGMEDGFELWTDVVTKGWFATDSLVQVKKENGAIVCPYVINRGSKTFIHEGDYIIIGSDGSRHACGERAFLAQFEPIEE